MTPLKCLSVWTVSANYYMNIPVGFRLKLLDTQKNYTCAGFHSDIVALPLAMANAIALGVPPHKARKTLPFEPSWGEGLLLIMQTLHRAKRKK